MINYDYLINIRKIFPKEDIKKELLLHDYHANLVYKYGLIGIDFLGSVAIAKKHIEIVNDPMTSIEDEDLLKFMSAGQSFK